MTFNQHPDDDLLQAYQQEPDAQRFNDVSLHLATCTECRQQLEQLHNLKSLYKYVENDSPNEQQQQTIDEFTYERLAGAEYDAARDEIRNNPVMLKSALYSLSMQQEPEPQNESQLAMTAQQNDSSLMSKLLEWFTRPTPMWAGFATAAVITVMFTAFILNNQLLQDGPKASVNIASYQDSSSMRFIPPQTVPGIGFFSAANNYAEPYDNLQLSLDADNRLRLQWSAVEKASQYQLMLYRYSNGEKHLVGKISTVETDTSVDFGLESFNQRFEWTLSGTTSEQVAFITSGGFVISQ